MDDKKEDPPGWFVVLAIFLIAGLFVALCTPLVIAFWRMIL